MEVEMDVRDIIRYRQLVYQSIAHRSQQRQQQRRQDFDDFKKNVADKGFFTALFERAKIDQPKGGDNGGGGKTGDVNTSNIDDEKVGNRVLFAVVCARRALMCESG